MAESQEYTIVFTPDCFHPDIKITIAVPADHDAEEYIDQYLESILNNNILYNCEWSFA